LLDVLWLNIVQGRGRITEKFESFGMAYPISFCVPTPLPGKVAATQAVSISGTVNAGAETVSTNFA
jgi:hypothetical protein